MRIIKSSILLNNRKKGSAFFYDTSEKLSGNLEHFSNRATVTGPFHRIRIARRDDLQLLRIRYSWCKANFPSHPWLDHFSPYPLTSCSTFRPRYLYHFIIPAASSCSFLVRSRRAESARLVLMRSCSIIFPPRKRANGFSCRCLSRCLIRSTSSSADERRNVGSATYTIEKVSTRKIPRYPLLFQP